MSEWDVVVVGGGPAGAAAAAFCARRGRRVALLEHHVFPRHKVCGEVINPNCWPLLRRLGAQDKVLACEPRPLTGARFSDDRGRELAVPAAGLAALSRRVLDACLLEHARACGVTVCEGTTVREVREGGRVVTDRGEWSAPVVIGADGRHSVVARRRGLLRGSNHRSGLLAFQSYFPAPPQFSDEVQLHLFPGGYCGIVRVDATRVNLCIVTDYRSAALRADTVKLFTRTVWQNPAFRKLGLEPAPLEQWHSAHPLWRPLARAADPGVWLVGDALRVVEPFTGQGIFFALSTAELAAGLIEESPQIYRRAAARWYRRHARTNAWLRRLLYHRPAARCAVAALSRWPVAAHWLANSVTGGNG